MNVFAFELINKHYQFQTEDAYADLQLCVLTPPDSVIKCPLTQYFHFVYQKLCLLVLNGNLCLFVAKWQNYIHLLESALHILWEMKCGYGQS